MQLPACIACLACLCATVVADEPYQQKPAEEEVASAPSKHLRDFWRTSLYKNVVFFDKKFYIDIPESQADQADKIMRTDVMNNAGQLGTGNPKVLALEDSDYKKGRVLKGTTCLVDERQQWTKNRGIAHFMKRLLPYYGYVSNPDSNLKCDNIGFPGTPDLDGDYYKSMVTLAVPNFSQMKDHQLLFEKDFKQSAKSEPLIFEKLLIPHRRHTYFRDTAAAQQFRETAWKIASIDSSKKRSKTSFCLYQRDPDEGKGRTVANEDKLMQILKSAITKKSDSAQFVSITCSSKMTWKQQVAAWAGCDAVVSPHGSHNINMMFMKPGSTFVEMNPKMFFYDAYANLAATTGLHYIGLRDSKWELDGVDDSVKKSVKIVSKYIHHGIDDVKCQDIHDCRVQSRNIPFSVNEQSFKEAANMVMRKVKKQKQPTQTLEKKQNKPLQSQTLLSMSDMQQLDVLEEADEETGTSNSERSTTFFKQQSVKQPEQSVKEPEQSVKEPEQAAKPPEVHMATYVPRQTAFGTALPHLHPTQQTTSQAQDAVPKTRMLFL